MSHANLFDQGLSELQKIQKSKKNSRLHPVLILSQVFSGKNVVMDANKPGLLIKALKLNKSAER
jgi:hypothetical protein